MKAAFRILITIVSLGVIFTNSGCKKSSPAETTQAKQLRLLSQTWKISTVSLGGVDQTAKWPGFQLTISGTSTSTTYNYTCTGRPALSPWPAGGGTNSLGTWSFGADPVTQIIRDPSSTPDTLPMTYTVTAASGSTKAALSISFNFTGNGYTRVSNVAGAWVFNFTN